MLPNHSLTRRSALALLLSVGGASLLAACGPAAAPPAPAAPPAATQAQAAAKPAAAATSVSASATAPTQPANIKTGGTLRWGQVGDLVTIDAIYWSPVSNNTLG